MVLFKTLIFTFVVPGTVTVLAPRWILAYVGVSSILFGEALWFASTSLFEYAAVVFIVFQVWVVLYEEPTLHRQFGESYQRYCESVPRWLPRRKKEDGRQG